MLTATNLAAGVGDLGRKQALIESLPFTLRGSASEAAFLAASKLHARTQDDFYPQGRVHVGAITLAATLALADDAGDRVLDCLAAGYEVMCLVAEEGSRYVQGRGLRPSGVFGPLGAAASAAVALGLDETGVANAIGLAAALAGGTNQAWLSGTDEWMIVVGQAARTGVEAALMTRAGVRASGEALDGKAAWGACFLDDPSAQGLRRSLQNVESRIPVVAAKKFPVSGIAQLVADLACDLHELNTSAPSRIVVGLAEAETRYPGTINGGPFKGQADALMSVPFAVACGLTHGAITLGRLEEPNRIGADETLAVIKVVATDEVEEAEAAMEVEWPGSEPVTRRVDGQIMHPSWEAIQADVAGLARRSEAGAEAVGAAVTELQRPRPDARALRTILFQGG